MNIAICIFLVERRIWLLHAYMVLLYIYEIYIARFSNMAALAVRSDISSQPSLPAVLNSRTNCGAACQAPVGAASNVLADLVLADPPPPPPQLF